MNGHILNIQGCKIYKKIWNKNLKIYFNRGDLTFFYEMPLGITFKIVNAGEFFCNLMIEILSNVILEWNYHFYNAFKIIFNNQFAPPQKKMKSKFSKAFQMQK